jgi:hypothetical protein
MEEMKYRELEERSIPAGITDLIKKQEARARIHAEIEQMRAEGKAYTLTTEEIQMIEAFRRFKLRMRKASEVFTFQTHRPEGVQIVQETAEVITPEEALQSA